MLGDTVTVYRRTAEVLYRNELAGAGGWAYPQGAEDALHAERARTWTAAESQWFIETAQRLTAAKPEELGPGMRDRWQASVREAIASAIPHLHDDFSADATRMLSTSELQNLSEARRLREASFPTPATPHGEQERPTTARSPRHGPARSPSTASTPEYD